MKTKRLLPLILLAFAVLACNFERVLDPSLSTPTIPAATPAPSSTLLPTLAPTATTAPTPEPAARVASGDHALFNGDWDAAAREYLLVLETTSDPDLQTAALLGLGRTRYLASDYPGALDALRTLLDTYPDSPHRAQAHFALGQVFDALERYAEAAQAYQQYVTLRPGLIDYYALVRRADALVNAGDYQNAINTYQAALGAPHLGDGLEINVKIGNAYALVGDFNSAIVVYSDVLARTTNDFVKAQMHLYIGQAHIALGQPDQAYATWQEATSKYPLSYDTYLALVELVNAAIPVNELDRGLIDYYAGQYAVAIAAFDRYLATQPAEFVDTALYYRALSRRALQDFQGALEDFDQVIQFHPQGKYWDLAYEQKAYTQWAFLDEYTTGSQTLLDFIASNPAHTRAAEFLFTAARITERAGELAAAAQHWDRVAVEYPTSAYAYRGYFLAGITRFRLADYAGALPSFQGALSLAVSSAELAASHFWIGKAQQALGDQGAAQASWSIAAAADPTGYYSERARDLLAGLPPFSPPPLYNLDYDVQSERAVAEAWTRTTFNLPQDTNLSDLGPLLGDTRLTRGAELWQLGLYNQARLEFESLRAAVVTDPANTYRLANYFIDLGLYRSGIIAARQVLDLSGMDDAGTMSAPLYFNHLRFGPYFADLVLPVAQAYGFEPLFLFSVIRQESLFEGFVTSTAGARGLMQIIPSTGQSIANNAGWPPNYTAADLYRPKVSITFGADYLADQRDYFDEQLYVALAAYNAGPGNAAIWWDLAAGDQDLFLEIIRFPETQNYIRGIYEIFTIYRNLYQQGL